jgi:hypothetical protein
MRIEQAQWTSADGWSRTLARAAELPALILVFGGRTALEHGGWRPGVEALRGSETSITGCSTAGEICGTQVADDSVVVTALHFDRARVVTASVSIEGPTESFAAGAELARQISRPDLTHVLVLSDGLHVNGSALVEGISQGLPTQIGVTGGLSGDGSRFAKTLVLVDGEPRSRAIVAIGLCGDIRVGCGSLGGWDPFGPERVVTRSDGNVLYELDGRNALDLYKTYLGDHAKELPAAGLLFPLSVREESADRAVVRTLLSVDEQAQSMTFAGDVPRGALARLMKANFDRLIDGAADAARTSQAPITGGEPEFALLISCIGRKLVLRQRIEEEVEGVRDVLGESTVLAGFYSYGEISPFTPTARCELHNQTMTVTTLSES